MERLRNWAKCHRRLIGEGDFDADFFLGLDGHCVSLGQQLPASGRAGACWREGLGKNEGLSGGRQLTACRLMLLEQLQQFGGGNDARGIGRAIDDESA